MTRMLSTNHLPVDHALLIRIVGQAADALLDTRGRLAAILNRVCPLIGAFCAAAAIARSGSTNSRPHFDCFASAGPCDNHARSALENYADKGWMTDPAYPIAMTRLMPKGGAVHRADILSDNDWYHSDHFLNCRKPGGIDGSIYAVAPLDTAGDYIAMSYHEKLGTRFDPRATDVVRTLVLGLTFIGEGYQREIEAQRLLDTLSPRLRDVLACYQLGMSAKEAAAQLGIKRSSVQQYSKSLHRHFDVNTRGELMARCRALRIEARLDDRQWTPSIDIDPIFASVVFPANRDPGAPAQAATPHDATKHTA